MSAVLGLEILNAQSDKAVIHANRLKPYHDPNTRPTNPPPEVPEPLLDDTSEESVTDSDEESGADYQQLSTSQTTMKEKIRNLNRQIQPPHFKTD